MAKVKPVFNAELVVGIRKSTFEILQTKEIATVHRMEDYLGSIKTIADIEQERERHNNNGAMHYDIRGFKNGIFMGSNFKFLSQSRGRSSVKFKYLVDDMLEVEFFVTDIADMIHENNHLMNNFGGCFTFVKRGQNYGIKMISYEYMKENPQSYKTVSQLIQELNFKETKPWKP